MEQFSTVCTGSLETVLRKNCPTRELLISKQWSSLRKTDSCITISARKSTGNTPNSKHNECHILTDEVYTNLEKVMLKKQWALNPIKMLKHILHQSLVVDTSLQ